jgi:methionine-rich copper-binding protein CopC
MRLSYGIAATLLSIMLLLAGEPAASAHAQLRSAMPAAGATVASSPAEVLVNFSETLEAAFSTVIVRDAVGKRVDKADTHLDSKDRKAMRVSLPPLTHGIYIVEWRALTTDTHRTEGAFIFRVGE